MRILIPVHKSAWMSGDLGRTFDLDPTPETGVGAPDDPWATRDAAPIDPLAATSFTNGRSSWNLDAAGVTNPGFANRTLAYRLPHKKLVAGADLREFASSLDIPADETGIKTNGKKMCKFLSVEWVSSLSKNKFKKYF